MARYKVENNKPEGFTNSSGLLNAYIRIDPVALFNYLVR